MNARPSPEPFDVLKAEACIRRENTLAVVSCRTFDDVATRLEACIASSPFALVSVHDFGRMFRGTDFELGHRSRVYELCDAVSAAQLLSMDPSLGHTLPYRIAMHDHGGVVTVSTPMPTVIVAQFSRTAAVDRIAGAVQTDLQHLLSGVV